MDEAFTRTITLDIEGIKGLTLLGEVIPRLEQHIIILGLRRLMIGKEEAILWSDRDVGYNSCTLLLLSIFVIHSILYSSDIA